MNNNAEMSIICQSNAQESCVRYYSNSSFWRIFCQNHYLLVVFLKTHACEFAPPFISPEVSTKKKETFKAGLQSLNDT